MKAGRSGERQRRLDDTDVRGIVRRSTIDHTSPQSAQRRYTKRSARLAAPTRVPAQTGQVARGADSRDGSSEAVMAHHAIARLFMQSASPSEAET